MDQACTIVESKARTYVNLLQPAGMYAKVVDNYLICLSTGKWLVAEYSNAESSTLRLLKEHSAELPTIWFDWLNEEIGNMLFGRLMESSPVPAQYCFEVKVVETKPATVNFIELAPGMHLNGKRSTDMCVKAAASYLKHSIESIPASEIAHLPPMGRSARFQIYAGIDAERFPRSELEDLNLVAVKQYGTPMVTGTNSQNCTASFIYVDGSTAGFGNVAQIVFESLSHECARYIEDEDLDEKLEEFFRQAQLDLSLKQYARAAAKFLVYCRWHPESAVTPRIRLAAEFLFNAYNLATASERSSILRCLSPEVSRCMQKGSRKQDLGVFLKNLLNIQ